MRRSKIAAVAALMAVGLVSACGSTTSSDSPSGAAAAEAEMPEFAPEAEIEPISEREREAEAALGWPA